MLNRNKQTLSWIALSMRPLHGDIFSNLLFFVKPVIHTAWTVNCSSVWKCKPGHFYKNLFRHITDRHKDLKNNINMYYCYSQQFVTEQVKDSLCPFLKCRISSPQHFGLLNEFIMKCRINVISIHFQHRNEFVVVYIHLIYHSKQRLHHTDS